MIIDWGGPGAYVVGPNILFGWQGGYAGIAEAPPIPPVAPGVGGGYLPSLLLTEPRLYTYRGVIFLGRLRVGSRVLFLENRAQAEDEELIALL